MSSDYCENCESGFQLFGDKCELLMICDALECPEDRICLVEDGQPKCSDFYCGLGLAIKITEHGEIACKTAMDPSDGCDWDHAHSHTCKQALTENSLTSHFACGQQHRDDYGCTGYDNCQFGSSTHWCKYHRDFQAQQKQHVCISNPNTGIIHGIGFNQSSKNFFCIADENWNCKEYPVGENSSGEDACYRDILSENWTNILTCGNQHRDLWGCDGYDGCAYGDEYWCRHLDEHFRDVFEEVCSCGDGKPGVSGPGVSGTNCYIHSALSIGESLCRNCVAEISDNSLHEAVSSGDTHCVMEILANGILGNDVDVNALETGGDLDTALHKTVVNDNYEIARILIGTSGINLDAVTGKYGPAHGTALYKAVRSGTLRMVMLLIESGADADYTNTRHQYASILHEWQVHKNIGHKLL